MCHQWWHVLWGASVSCLYKQSGVFNTCILFMTLRSDACNLSSTLTWRVGDAFCSQGPPKGTLSCSILDPLCLTTPLSNNLNVMFLGSAELVWSNVVLKEKHLLTRDVSLHLLHQYIYVSWPWQITIIITSYTKKLFPALAQQKHFIVQNSTWALRWMNTLFQIQCL